MLKLCARSLSLSAQHRVPLVVDWGMEASEERRKRLRLMKDQSEVTNRAETQGG